MSEVKLKVDEPTSTSLNVTEGIIYAISPTAKVERETDGVFITITDKNGTTTAEVFDGAKGDKGTDGYSPVRGVDYFTEEDKTAMVNAVLAQVVDATEVEY